MTVATLAKFSPAHNNTLFGIARQIIQVVLFEFFWYVLGNLGAYYPVILILQMVDGHAQVKKLTATLGRFFSEWCTIERIV